MWMWNSNRNNNNKQRQIQQNRFCLWKLAAIFRVRWMSLSKFFCATQVSIGFQPFFLSLASCLPLIIASHITFYACIHSPSLSHIYDQHTHTHRRQNMQHKVIVAGKHCSIVKRQNYSEGFGQLWSCIKIVCLFNCPQCPVNRTVITNPVHHKQSAGSWCILRIIRVIAKLKTNHIHCVYML